MILYREPPLTIQSSNIILNDYHKSLLIIRYQTIQQLLNSSDHEVNPKSQTVIKIQIIDLALTFYPFLNLSQKFRLLLLLS